MIRASLLIEISVMGAFFVAILVKTDHNNFRSGRLMSFLGRLVQSATYLLEMLL